MVLSAEFETETKSGSCPDPKQYIEEKKLISHMYMPSPVADLEGAVAAPGFTVWGGLSTSAKGARMEAP